MKWFKRKNHEQQLPTLEEQRAEKLREIGAQLWAARQERGLSLEEMVVITKISRRLLQAIEEGNLVDLPEPVYIQGFIRQYADALGFNGAEFAKAFPVVSAPVVTAPAVPPINRSLGLLRPIHLYLLYIFVIVCSVSSLSHVLNRAAISANDSESPQPETVLQPTPSPEKQPTQAQPVSDTVSSNQENQSVQIGVTLKEASWIRVVADGKTQFEGILPEGTHRVWKAQDQLTVKTDNAGSVMMSVNQQAAKQMGAPGQPEEVKIAAAKPQ